MIEPALLFGGRYELGPVIGRGGMAEVRGGRDSRLDRPVAVKVLRPEMALQPGVRDRFESEARLAARLNHPNVVAVFDSGEHDGVPYIVMERLPGETLQDRLAAGPLDEAEVRAMAIQVLAALQAAHEAGVLHRDIKPGNVLAAGTGRWKVGDFGIAKALEVDRSDATATGFLIGTPAYLAPERIFGSAATVASDLYSVGVVLYEALAGHKPFEADRPDGWATAVTGTAAPLETLRPGVDPDLAAAVARCLARDPADRFWSAAEMEAQLTGRPAVSRGAAADPTEVLTGGAPAPTTYRAPDGPGWDRPPTEVLPLSDRVRAAGSRSRAWWRRAGWGLAALVAVVVVVVAVALSGSGGGGSTSPPSTRPAPTAATVPAAPGQGLPPALSRALDNLRRQVTAGR